MRCRLYLCLLVAGVCILAAGRPAPASSLTEAASRGDTEKVQTLLAHSADVNAKDSDGSTALMAAAKGGHTNIVKTLLAHGAAVNARDNNSSTALIWTVTWSGHTDTVQLLLAQGADVDAKDNRGGTALMAAKREGHRELVRILKEAGAKE